MNQMQPYLWYSGFSTSLPFLIIFRLARSMPLAILRSVTHPQYTDAAMAKRIAKNNPIPIALTLT